MTEAILTAPEAKTSPAAKPPRTPASVRAEAKAHFDWFAARPCFMELTAEQCQAEARLGELLVEEALNLLPNEVLDIQGFFATHAQDAEAQSLAMAALLPITGFLKLLRCEFVHPQVGVLPHNEVCAVFDSPLPREYRGVMLTRGTVYCQYVRLPL